MKKLIDERGRIFGRVNAMDALVLLVVLVLIAAFALRAQRLAANNVQQPTSSVTAPEEPVPVVYEVTLYNTSIGHVEDIRKGDILYDKDNNGVNVGNIVDVQVSECYQPSQLADGSYVMAPVHGRYRIVLTVESEARPVKDGRLFIRWGSELAAGLSYNYCTKYCLFTAVITSVEWEAEAMEVWNNYITAGVNKDAV